MLVWTLAIDRTLRGAAAKPHILRHYPMTEAGKSSIRAGMAELGGLWTAGFDEAPAMQERYLRHMRASDKVALVGRLRIVSLRRRQACEFPSGADFKAFLARLQAQRVSRGLAKRTASIIIAWVHRLFLCRRGLVVWQLRLPSMHTSLRAGAC